MVAGARVGVRGDRLAGLERSFRKVCPCDRCGRVLGRDLRRVLVVEQSRLRFFVAGEECGLGSEQITE